jgi:hypothetical protein
VANKSSHELFGKTEGRAIHFCNHDCAAMRIYAVAEVGEKGENAKMQENAVS